MIISSNSHDSYDIWHDTPRLLRDPVKTREADKANDCRKKILQRK